MPDKNIIVALQLGSRAQLTWPVLARAPARLIKSCASKPIIGARPRSAAIDTEDTEDFLQQQQLTYPALVS